MISKKFNSKLLTVHVLIEHSTVYTQV